MNLVVESQSDLEVECEGNPLVKLVSDCLLLIQILIHRAQAWVGYHRAYLLNFKYFKQIELFDKDSTAKEKGRISVKFQDKDMNFSQRSEQPCQVHQN